MRGLLIMSLFLVGCGRRSADTTAAVSSASEANTSSDWQVFEDDWFRVAYPAGSDVGGGADGKQDPKFPTLTVVPKTAGDGIGGAFTLQFDKRTNGMLLRDAIQSAVKVSVGERGKLLAPPKEVRLKNGRCLSAMTSAPFDNCPKGQGSCFSPFILTVCDDAGGRRYTANTLLSRGKDPDGLSPQAQQEAATYERILRSLEFKKS